MGGAYLAKGEYEKAIKYYQHGLAIQLKVYEYSLNHPDIAKSYTSLGRAYSSKGEYEEAINYYKQGLAIQLKAYGDSSNHPAIAAIYNNLGGAYSSKGEYEKAIKYYQQGLAIRLKAYEHSPNHPAIAKSYDSLGTVYVAKGEYREAINYFQQGLAIQLKVYEYSPYHPDIAASYNNLGSTHAAKEEYKEAIKYYQQGLDIQLKAYEHSPNHPDIAASYNNLGSTHAAKEEYKEAIKCYQQGLAIWLKAYEHSPNHPDIAMSYTNLGSTCAAKEEYEEAIKYYQQGLAIQLKAYEHSPNHPDIAMSYTNLGSTCAAKEEYEEAINYYQQGLAIRLKAYEHSPNHPDIAASYNNLGNAYLNKGEYEEAIKCYQQGLIIQLKIYEHSPNHSDIAISYYNLTIVYLNTGKYEQSHFYAKKALEVYSKPQNQQLTLKFEALYKVTLIQLGNIALLEEDIKKANDYFGQLGLKYRDINFYSPEFINLQLGTIEAAYESKLLLTAINCQKVLIKIDSELKNGNHYHNLACFYACSRNLKEANEAFIQAFNHPHAKITGGLHAEYSQFLILNRDNILSDIKEISKHLYLSIDSDNIGCLQYGVIEKSTVSTTIKALIKQKNATIKINPKILAYHLLITYPEYIMEGDNVDNLLKSFCNYCDNLQDKTSFTLLSNACESIGNTELALKCSEQAKLIGHIDAIIDGKAKLKNNNEDINFQAIQDFTVNLNKLAWQAVVEQELEDAIKLFTKAFQIYKTILPNQSEQLQLAVNNLATFSLLINNINQFVTLKLYYKATLNNDLVKLLGQDVNMMMAIEQQINTQLQIAMQQQNIEEITNASENTETEITLLGNNDNPANS